MALTLKEWRRARGYSIASMAREIGVDSRTYASWEENPGKLSIDMAKSIADTLEIPADYIFFPLDTTKCSKEG